MISITAQIEGIEWIVLLVMMAVVVLLFVRFVLLFLVRTKVREVVKIRCHQCGALNVETARMCVTCQAPL